MKTLTKEEMEKYVLERLPFSTIIEAKKIGNTHAVRGKIGQEVVSYSFDNNGNEIIEKVASVTLDVETKEPGWILTKIDADNNPVINKNGHLNQYIVADSVFKNTYEPSADGPDLYSKKKIEKLIQIDEDLQFGTEYGDMIVYRGGYVIVTDLTKIFGISEVDFNDTYVVIDPKVEKIR